MLAQLTEQGLVQTPADLYRLDKETLAGLERMGKNRLTTFWLLLKSPRGMIFIA